MEGFITGSFTFYDYNNYDDSINYHGRMYVDSINYNGSNYDDYHDSMYYNNIIFRFIPFVATCVIMCIALPFTLLAICNLCRLVRNDHVGPIYVINLLISNLIRLCCLIVLMARSVIWSVSLIVLFIYHWSLMASVCFMVCIALERYLIIACPLLNSSRRSIKISVVVCVVVWILALVFLLILHFQLNIDYHRTIFGVLFLLPFPLFIFFLGGTLKALSASRVPSDEKQRIVGILVLLLFIYMLLFLPITIYHLTARTINNNTFWIPFEMFRRLSPLADLTLYVFMKKGTIDKLLSSVCCCRMDSSDINSSPV